MERPLDPTPILQIGMGYFASKALLSAVELGLFSTLGGEALPKNDLEKKLGLHPRSSADFLDALVALGMLEREGGGEGARYANTPLTRAFLDQASPQYMGGIFEMSSRRLYRHWADLTEGLQTGEPQSEAKHSQDDLFTALYSDPARLESFLAAMAGVQKGNFQALAEKFDFSRFGTVCDAGGASAAFSLTVAQRHPSVRCISFDLPQVEPIARKNILRAGLSDRVRHQNGDFFRDPLPKADVIAMGNILHDWNLEEKRALVRKAFEALPTGGCFIAIENIIDDDRRKNAFGLLMSLNMLIETRGGFDYTGAQFRSWCTGAGFRNVEIVPLTGPSSAAIAYK